MAQMICIRPCGKKSQLMLWILLVIVPYARHIAGDKENSCPCRPLPDDEETPSFYSYKEQSARIGESSYLHCCVKHVLGKSKSNSSFIISWHLNDKPLHTVGSTFNAMDGCRNETLFSKNVSETDQGNYKCLIETPVDDPKEVTTNFKVSEKCTYHEAPNEMAIAHYDQCRPGTPCDIQARLSEPLNLTCKALVGKCTTGSIQWIPRNRSKEVRSRLKSDKKYNTWEDNVAQSTMVIPSVTRDHFGQYLCRAISAVGQERIYLTLKEEENSVTEHGKNHSVQKTVIRNSLGAQ